MVGATISTQRTRGKEGKISLYILLIAFLKINIKRATLVNVSNPAGIF